MECFACGTSVPVESRYCGTCGSEMRSVSTRKTISPKLRFEVLLRDGFRCIYCGRTGQNIELQIDHLIPVSGGGSNELENLVTSCQECNQGKRSTDILSVSAHSRKWAHVARTMNLIERDLVLLRQKHLDEHQDSALSIFRDLERRMRQILVKVQEAAQAGDSFGLEYWLKIAQGLSKKSQECEWIIEVSEEMSRQEKVFRRKLRELNFQLNAVKNQYEWSEDEETQLQQMVQDLQDRIEKKNASMGERTNKELFDQSKHLGEEVTRLSLELKDIVKDFDQRADFISTEQMYPLTMNSLKFLSRD
jgi:hypothetical protein